MESVSEESAKEFLERVYHPEEIRFLQNQGYHIPLELIDIEGFFSNSFTNPQNIDLSKRVCHGNPTVNDLREANLITNTKSEWILTDSLRTKLYIHLFVPVSNMTSGTEGAYPLLDDIVQEKIKIVSRFQQFAIVASLAPFYRPPNNILERPKQSPNLEHFVDDAICLLKILQAPLPPSDSRNLQDYDHPFFQFDQHRRGSWDSRWDSCIDFTVTEWKRYWEDYKCGLTDALFGLWPAPGPQTFHSGGGKKDGCIGTVLGSLVLHGREPDTIPTINVNHLDAKYIQSNGPFRFKATKRLDDHLVVTSKDEILIYTDLKKWAGIKDHRVLRTNVEECTAFDILTTESRKCSEVQSIRDHLYSLYNDLQISILVIFFQDSYESAATETRRSLRTSFLNGRCIGGQSSVDIASRLKIRATEAEVLARTNYFIQGWHTWRAYFGRDSETRLLCPFKFRVDELYSTLKEWKPRTIWELRYRGYGSVDLIGLYGFYFALIIGVSGITAFAVSVAQMYASFKALGRNS